MKKTFVIVFFLLMTGYVHAEYTLQDIQKLRNDKEVMISSITPKEVRRINSQYSDPARTKRMSDAFYKSVLEFVNREDKQCEFALMKSLVKSLTREGAASKETIEETLKVLRINHAIDDILYGILSSVNDDYHALKKLNITPPLKNTKIESSLVTANKLPELFSGFSEFPDESERCFYQEYMYISNNTKNADGKKWINFKLFKSLTAKAYEENIISLETYKKIAYLQKNSEIHDRDIWLRDYLKIIFNAKNKMIPRNQKYQPVKLEDENPFSSERVKKIGLTRRNLLYRKYSPTHVILLAQVMQKASRRMGVDLDTDSKRPYISQEFSVLEENGSRRTYVEITELDPQSQYNFARRMMRKDMIELQMMDIFVGVKITHEDMVMAALETGYVSLEDIAYVIKYDDLWNPHKTKFEKMTSFVSKITGYATFMLPPPWNIVTSLALGVVEGIIESKDRKGTDNENPATFIN